MEILYSQKAAKQLRSISKHDRKRAASIIQKIEAYSKNPQKNYKIKILKGKLASFKRLRVRDYRIIFDDEHEIMHIYEIKHRQEAYT